MEKEVDGVAEAEADAGSRAEGKEVESEAASE